MLKCHRSLWVQRSLVEAETRRLADRFGIRIYSLAVARDHVHLVLLLPDRRSYAAFIRSLTGILARKLGRGLWRFLPFSRVASWGRDFLALCRYLRKNREEALGPRPYEKRRDWYRRDRVRADPRSPPYGGE